MSYRLDDVCRDILKALRIASKDYAGIMSATHISSYQTVKRHLDHLKLKKLVVDKIERKGRKRYHEVVLTGRGRRVAVRS